MTNITWDDPIPHDGSPDCPADARDVPCMVTEGDGWLGNGTLTGKSWKWSTVMAYRIPVTAPDVTADLVAALEWYREQFCEGFCEDLQSEGQYCSAMDIDCSGCKARAALTAYKEQRK